MIEQIPWGEDESLGRAWWDESAKICNATNQQKIFAACYHSGWTATASARAAKYSGNEDTLLLGPTDGLPSKDWTAVECDARCPACRTAPLCWSDTQRCRVRIGERLTHAARMGDKAKPSDRRNTGGFAVRSTLNLSGSNASRGGINVRDIHFLLAVPRPYPPDPVFEIAGDLLDRTQ